MQDLSSLTRDWTHAPCNGSAAGKSKWFLFKGLAQSLPYSPTPTGASFHKARACHHKSFAKNPFVCNVNPFVLVLVPQIQISHNWLFLSEGYPPTGQTKPLLDGPSESLAGPGGQLGVAAVPGRVSALSACRHFFPSLTPGFQILALPSGFCGWLYLKVFRTKREPSISKHWASLPRRFLINAEREQIRKRRCHLWRSHPDFSHFQCPQHFAQYWHHRHEVKGQQVTGPGRNYS